MRYRFLACIFAVCFVAIGQTQRLTVQQLISFIKNQQEQIKIGRSTDRETARFLGSVKLTEKLEDRIIEDLQSLGIGKLTAAALEKLKEQSQGLGAAVIQVELPDDPIPIPTSLEQGAILDDVRQYVANYDESLPDFICTEVERRKVAARPGGKYGGHSGSDPSFIDDGTITSKLSYFQHKENKQVILIGSAPTNQSYENLGGATSTGDFETQLKLLFATETHARFEWARWATLRDRLTMVFSFRVEQSRSQYSIQVKDLKRQIVAGYTGEVFIDKETHAVMRLLTRAEDIPPDFPVRRAQEQLDYNYADIGGHPFLLPFVAELQLDGTDVLNKNILEFRYYKKYEVGSAISYDIPADMSAVPDAQLKETPAKPAIDCKDPKNKDAAECKK